MDALSESLKQVVKEAVSEALRETLREFQLPRPTQVGQQNASKHVESKKLAVKIDEAAEMLSLSTATVRRLVADGSLKVSRKTRHVLIPIEELKRMMDV
jgi:excisionase family DNA binding protein